jgi:hypothetical protein
LAWANTLPAAARARINARHMIKMLGRMGGV